MRILAGIFITLGLSTGCVFFLGIVRIQELGKIPMYWLPFILIALAISAAALAIAAFRVVDK